MKQLLIKENLRDPETFETFYAGSTVSVGEDGDISEQQANRLAARHGSRVEESSEVATDAAVEAAQEEGVDLTAVEGSGSGGKVTAADVRKAKK